MVVAARLAIVVVVVEVVVVRVLVEVRVSTAVAVGGVVALAVLVVVVAVVVVWLEELSVSRDLCGICCWHRCNLRLHILNPQLAFVKLSGGIIKGRCLALAVQHLCKGEGCQQEQHCHGAAACPRHSPPSVTPSAARQTERPGTRLESLRLGWPGLACACIIAAPIAPPWRQTESERLKD